MALRRAGRGQTLQLPVSSVTCSGRAPTPSPLATCARTWHPAARSVHPGQALTQGFQRNRSLPAPPPEPSSGLDAAASARSSPGVTGLNCVMPGRFLHLSEPQFPVCEMGRAAVPASQSGSTDLQEQVDGALARGSSKLCSWVSPTIKVLGCWGRSARAESPGWGFPTTERAPKPHGREFRERDSKGENQGNRWLVVQRVPRPKSKIPVLETRPPSWDDSTRHKQSLRGPELPLPEREARPPFLQRDTPHFNCPLIAAGPESPACGKFSAAPHPPACIPV